MVAHVLVQYQCLSPLTLSSNPAHGEVYLIQHYVIKFCQGLVAGCLVFSLGTPVSFTNKAY